jgi:hypothetical protein
MYGGVAGKAGDRLPMQIPEKEKRVLMFNRVCGTRVIDVYMEATKQAGPAGRCDWKLRPRTANSAERTRHQQRIAYCAHVPIRRN